jgi:peptidoglycan/LPS O-acetylase OafA/YrhL
MGHIFDQLRIAAARIWTAKPAGRHDLVGIQYVRGIAALMVVARHVSLTMAEPQYYARPLLGGVLATGQVGVDVFFCLSGFIITYIAMDAHGAPTMGPWIFFKRRFARIVPFMWLVIVAYAGLRLFGRGTFPIWNYVRAATLFPLGDVDPSVVWTLRYEALFYGVFALTALTRRPCWSLAWALSPLVLQLTAKIFGPYLGLGPDLAAFAFSPINLLFASGAALGLVYLRRRSAWPRLVWAAPCLMVGMTTVFLVALMINYQRGVIWEVIVVGLISCACLATACSVKPSQGLIASLGRRLGDASYCIYLTHVAFVSAILGIASRHLQSQPDVAIAVGAFVLAVSAGLGLHYLVERPVIAYSQRLLFPPVG